MTPEGKVKKKIDALLKKYDVWFNKPRGTLLGRGGIPDYDCIAYGGVSFKIEAKSETGRLTALQERVHEDIKKRGGIVMVIRESNLFELEKLLNALPSKCDVCGAPIEDCRECDYPLAWGKQ